MPHPAGWSRGRARFGSALALACAVGALLLGSAASGRAERDRPPPAHTGGFSEPTCTGCHFDAAVNTGTGTLSVDGLPTTYEPGGTYTLTLTLAQKDLRAGGFQMSSRFEDGSQAGSLAAASVDAARVDVSTLAHIQYIHHVYAGSRRVAPDTARWHLLWTAPDSGDVLLHIAANAADDDESPLGDMIYTRTERRSAARQLETRLRVTTHR